MLRSTFAQPILYQKLWGGSAADIGYSVANDTAGNIYVVGQTTSFGAGGSDALILKYDPSGNLIFQKTWGTPQDDSARDVGVDAAGEIYVTGYTYNSTGNAHVFVLKFDSTGNLLSQVTWRGPQNDFAYSMAIDSAGNVYVTGSTSSFGAGGLDVLLLKYDSSLNLIWQKTWGGPVDDVGNHVTTDNQGNVYVTGGTYSFGAGSQDVLLLKYDSSGNLLWQKTWGGPLFDVGESIDFDEAAGVLLVTGYTLSFGQGAADALLLAYDTSGNLLFQDTWGGIHDDYGFGVIHDQFGNIYITGATNSFGAGGYDVFLLKGNVACACIISQEAWGGTGDDFGYGVTVDPEGDAWITGYTSTGSHQLTQNIPGVVGNPNGSIFTLTTPSGTQTNPTGTTGTAAGSLSIPPCPNDQCESYAGSSDVFLLEFETQAKFASSTTGAGTVIIQTSAGGLFSVQPIQLSSISGPPPVGLTFPYGLFSFNVTGLPIGGTALLTTSLPSAVPAWDGVQVWKTVGGSWRQFPAGSVTLSSDRTSVSVAVTDGAPGFDDDPKPGEIVNTIAIGFLPSISLVAGWNMISLPVIPTNAAIASVLAPLIAKHEVSAVWTYKAASKSWQFFVPPASGTLNTMTDGNGYWIYMHAPDSLTVNGTVVQSTSAPPTYPLVAGWNLVGFKPFPSVQPETVTQYLTSLPGTSYDSNQISFYDATTASWVRANGSTMLQPGQALWIFMVTPATLKP